MTRVAFLIDIVDSFGERELALRFARRLPAGVAPLFVTERNVAPHFAGQGETASYDSVDEAWQALRAADPALVICCEFFNLPPPLRERVVGGPWKLVTTDGMAMGVEINTNPFGVPGAARGLELPAGMARLRNCPVNDPLPDDSLLFHWALWPGLARGDGAALRASWGIPPRDRVLMMAVSPWAARAAAGLGHVHHYRRLVERVVVELAALGVDATFMIVATPPAVRRVGRVTVRTLGYLPPDVYERLLLGSDLVVSDNIIQLSVGKAFVAGVPTMVLTNSRPEVGPRYNIFPVRLHFPETEYVRSLAPVELGDGDAIRARLAVALGGEPARGAAYRAALDRLRSPAEIVSILLS